MISRIGNLPPAALNPVLATILFAAPLLSSCTSNQEQVLTDACVTAGRSSGSRADTDSLTARCQCASAAAKKYLDPDDYKLLVGVAGIYSENTTDGVKLEKLIDGFIDSGLTPAKASVAGMDMLLMAHRAANECGASGRPNV